MRTKRAALNRMEFLMSIKTKIAALALATLAVTGSMASTTTPAEAKGLGLGWGIGAGLIGAAVVGSAIAASDGYLLRRLSPLRLGSPVRRLRQLHGPRSYLQLLIDRLSPEHSFETPDRGSCVRHGRLIHPRAVPDPPGCPPGRVNFFRLISLIRATTSFQPLT